MLKPCLLFNKLWMIQCSLRFAATTKSKQAWEALEISYQGTTKVKVAKLQALRRSFEKFYMNASTSIDHFFTEVMNIVNQMRSHGESIVDQKVIEKILKSLPSKFDVIVVAIEESKDLAQLFIDELLGSLLSHESKMNRNNNSSLENAFRSQVSFSRGRGRSNFRGIGRGRGGHMSPDQGEWTNQSNQRFNNRG